ncbi:reverse transcriptase domain-containing protein [Tanacetum coccineum]
MTSGREITPPPSFSAIPTTTTMFSATTPENMPLSYRASTSTNPNPVISPAFVEANYETLNEDYDEEREMEPRPKPARAVTPPLRAAVERNSEGGRPSKEASRGNESQNVNLPPLLAAHIGRSENGKPLQSSLTSAYGGQALLNNVGGNLPHNEDYPLPDGLKMPSHIGSYNRKGDPDNFQHLFEGAIRMQKWLMPLACHMFTYTLKDSARIWWNSQKAGSILDYEDLKVKFRSHFSQQKKFIKIHLVVHNIKQRENESTRAFITRYTDDTLQILGLYEDQRISSFIHVLRTRSLVEHLSIDLSLTYKGLTEKTYTWVEAREVATNGVSGDRRYSFERPKKSSCDNNKGQKNKDRATFAFGERHKKEKAKSTITPRGEDKKDKSIVPVEAPILMISTEKYAAKDTVSESMAYKEGITFPPVMRVSNAPVIIKAVLFGRKSKHENPLVGFSGKRSWSIGEVPLEITIGEHPFSRTKTLNFVFVKSDSPHNMLLGRTAMQKMGIVVSTIHGDLKFHTKKGIGSMLLVDEAGEETKKARRTLTISKERIPSYDDTEEKIIVNDKHPEQMVTIRK